MLKRVKERARIVQDLLDIYVPEPQIPLEHTNPYTLLIAVLLSAQCTDERVNRVTPLLFQNISTPEQMLELSLDEVIGFVRSCGFYQVKARNILKLSKILVDQFGGRVPQTFEELETLPGVGHKTASVVMVQAFNIPAFPVDTHIFRSALRWGLSSKKTVEGVEEDFKKLYPKKVWGRLHLQIIHYARAFCRARGHIISECPICTTLKQTFED